MPAETPIIVPMRQADLASVERVARSDGGLAWPRSELEAELTRPHSLARVLRPGPGLPIGAFVICWVTGSEAQLLHLAVEAGQRRRGYGRALLRSALVATHARGASDMVLEVRVSNAPALALYASEGFQRIGIRQRYYSDNGEDALVMKRAIA
ncbi:MAG: ribosomal protein S18-alanine N-acetyltransferase [Myxococcales bacterium]|nr:ribosomal protein S18-alanine N-acetyltransferase [Myxococcales bacterium]